jgi:hypothetical protein
MDALLVYLPWESLVVCCYGCTLVPLTWESVVLQMVDAFLVNLLCKNAVFQMVGAFFGAFGSGKCIGLLLVGAFLCVWYVGVWW